MNGQYRECPFCDKDGFQEVEEATFKTHTEYRVACANCGAHGPNEISVEQAIKKWNLRRPFDMLQAQLIGLNQRITAFAGQLQAWGYENAARELISEILGGIVDAPDYYTLQDELAKEKARTESLGAVLSYAVNMITQMASVIEIRGRLPDWQRPTKDGTKCLLYGSLPDYAGQICTAWQLVDEIMESCFGVLIGTSHEGTFCQILQEDQPEIIESAMDERCSWCMGKDGKHEPDCEANNWLVSSPNKTQEVEE